MRFCRRHIKRVADSQGDTVKMRAARQALPDLKPSSPMFFRWAVSVLADDMNRCATARQIELNEAAFFYEPENSVALGSVFRCGFWACCTWKSCRKRLEREFGLIS